MSTSFRLDRHSGRLYDDAGRWFDATARTWAIAGPPTGDAIDALTAATWLQRDSGTPCRVPVGVIGPRDASALQLRTAEQIGEGVAALGLAILCGGREGVMAAVAKGARRAGGTIIGLLPDADPALANPDIGIVIATGIGEARNALIARAALCLVAIGNSHGTLSEVALGRHSGKLVIGLEGAAQVDGVRHVQWKEALTLVAHSALNHPG